MSVVIEAQRASDCDGCDFGIRRGQKITVTAGGDWVHVVCPAARQTCNECFTEISVSGACLCEDGS